MANSAGHAVTYSYDAVGQRAGMLVPDAGRFTYAWDARGQIAHLINAQADRTTFSYDAAARRTLTELANGTRTSYTYDAASRVQQLYNLKAGGSVILGLTYEHDAVGNPTGMLESSGDRVTWTYDATDRLTREQRSGPSAYDTTYTYDPLGNRLVKDASSARTTYAYDRANQMTTSQDAAGTTTYTYDLAGNLHIVEQPTGQRTTTTWDDQNRQTGVLFPDGSAVTNTFRFDGLRHSKEDSAGTTKFIWDFNNYLAETDAADEIRAVYTNEPQQYGNVISQYRKAPTLWLPSYYHYDALGSARALTDGSAQTTDTYLYDAWGNAIASTGSTDNPFRWVGQVGYHWDECTGTFYIRARVYEPVTGRFTSQDLTGFEGPPYSLYQYALSRPLSELDPSGEITVTLTTPTIQPACNRQNDVIFKFDLEYKDAKGKPGAPCAGFIVQKVTVECHISLCRTCRECRAPGDPQGPPKKLTVFSYWESWFLRKGDTSVIDRAYIPSWKDSCGYYKQTGEIKFYCMDRNSDPRERTRRVGIGDLRRKWTVDPKTPFNTDGGNPLCSTGAGVLHATRRPEEATFWAEIPLEGPATRAYTLDFDCCEKSGTVLITTDPEFKR